MNGDEIAGGTPVKKDPEPVLKKKFRLENGHGTATAAQLTGSSPKFPFMTEGKMALLAEAKLSKLSGSKAKLSVERSELQKSKSKLPADRLELPATKAKLSGDGLQLSDSKAELSADRLQLHATEAKLSGDGLKLPESKSKLPANRIQPSATKARLSSDKLQQATKAKLSGDGSQFSKTKGKLSADRIELPTSKAELPVGDGLKTPKSGAKPSGDGLQVSPSGSKLSEDISAKLFDKESSMTQSGAELPTALVTSPGSAKMTSDGVQSPQSVENENSKRKGVTKCATPVRIRCD